MAGLEVKQVHVYLFGGLLALLLLSKRMVVSLDRIKNVLYKFIPEVEGFSSVPYWDVSRYSWGYGTAAPGAAGTITRDQAAKEMTAYLVQDYEKLKGRVTRELTANQWAALLSFAYSTGIGNAYNLLANINTYNDSVLYTQWRKYIYAGGVINDTLIERREKELILWGT